MPQPSHQKHPFVASNLVPLLDLVESADIEPSREGAGLRGTKCIQCSQLMIGQRYACSGCMSSRLAPAELAQDGEIYSWSRVHISKDREEPFVLAYVDLSDGVRVLTEIIGATEPEIGGFVRLQSNRQGQWWFSPAEKETAQ